MRILPLLSFSLAFLLCSGCVVSKKKYDSLEAAKKRSDLKARELTKENAGIKQSLKAKTKESNDLSKQLSDFKRDYNDIKNQMLESNARKTSLIEDLNRKLSSLSTNNKTAKDSLQKMIQRLDKRASNYESKQLELRKRFSDLEGIETALAAHGEKLDALEQFISHNFDKNSILDAYVMNDGGFLYLTFDPGSLFDKEGAELTSNSKRTLKIIAAALQNQAPVKLVGAANWDDGTSTGSAWELTQKKANIVFAFLNENGTSSTEHFSIGQEKIEKQKIAESGSSHQLTLVLYPPLKALTQTGI